MFLQIAVVLLACRLVGQAVGRLGQPRVVGEILAGIALGPSLLGQFSPCLDDFLFARATLPPLLALSKVGLVFYMFLVGAELDLAAGRRLLRGAVRVAVAGVAVPMALGCVLGAILRDDVALFAQSVPASVRVLFLGSAMSITALPVMARILEERGLSRSPIGTLALSAGAVTDGVAWGVLTLILASVGRPGTLTLSLGGMALYGALLWAIGRPLLRRICEAPSATPRGLLMPVMILLLVSAFFSSAIGLHEVFGAFLLGLVLPRGPITRGLHALLLPVTADVLLPLYFAYSGLNTRIGILDTWALWGIAAAAFAVACLGKGVACGLAARAAGQSGRDSVAIGALMNARGMMELIVLNIGLERGIIRPALFTLMVLMTVGTTMLTLPVFDLAARRQAKSPLTRKNS